MQCFVFSSVFKLLIVLCVCLCFVDGEDRKCGLNPVFRSAGDLQLVVIANECSSSLLANTIILTSAWITERFNVLKIFDNFKIGVDVFHICSDKNMIDPIVNNAKNKEFNLGTIIAWKPVPSKIRELSNVLETPITVVTKQWEPLVTATVGLLSALQWNENLTIVTDEQNVLSLFYHESRKEWICVTTIKSFRDVQNLNSNNPTVIFGNGDEIIQLLKITSQQWETKKIIVVPLDGTHLEGLPDGTYILQPIYADNHQKFTKPPKIIPSPILLNIAVPLIKIAKNTSNVLRNFCNQTDNQIACLKNNSKHIQNFEISQLEILEFLKIEPLIEKFVYNIFKVEHLNLLSQKSNDSNLNVSIVENLVKIGSYNLFNFTLNLDEVVLEENNATNNETGENTCFNNHKLCIYQCLNFKSVHPGSPDEFLLYNIVLKQDSWILAVLAIASLGILFCVAILIFIFVRLCKKDIFEGNPVLSVLLLLSLTVMYASVVPFALEVTFETEFRSTLSNYICLARSLAVTLSYSSVFSLMLSRCVMLATVAYEAGFMSHITGHVQSLLCLFMIAVQGALSLQSVENCQELLVSNSFLYALSYNILLLGLLFCSCPFIYRSQRNYKEGRYFTIAILLIVLCWIIWLTVYIFVDDKWKMAAVCSGLLGTASAILGAVFIPRTYLMTSAVVRDSLTSALPSLAFASSTSVLDLNYTNSQHVYDCVNIAAINANMTQTLPTAVSQCNPNFYSEEPNLETTEINANSLPCDGSDKVTRF